jgi:hypothetical protein
MRKIARDTYEPTGFDFHDLDTLSEYLHGLVT